MTRFDTPARSADATATALEATDIFNAVGEVPYAWDIASDALQWGGNAATVLKLADPGVIASGRGFASLLDADNAQSRFDAVTRSNDCDTGGGVAYQAQYSIQPQPGSGAKLWIEDVGRWFAGRDGRPARALGVVRVINERRAREERLAFLSTFDALTGELNRFHLTEALSSAINDAIRLRSSCGFMIVAIDNLARVNEIYGFEVADEVIAAVAKRLRAKMRGVDTLGRFSGNKFGVVLKTCVPDDMPIAADRLLAGVRDDVVQTNAGPVAVTVTIGGVNAPRHARNLSEVLARAQEALNAAKAKRHGSFHPYQPNVERDAQRRANLRSGDEIVSALNERRIAVAFEPVVSALTRQPVFHECLMRIRRPDGSWAVTGDAIALAERLGLVRLIDHRMLELVVEELVAAPALCASLNASAASTVDPDWWDSLAALLKAHPGVAERLIVEITESAVIQDIDDTRGFVARVKDLGCRIAIDDFGAGYTSFRSLRKLGVDLVKIDGAFVQNLTRCEDDRAFVQTLIDLPKRLGLQTVAEWVQDEPAAALLRDWGCDYLQGKLIGPASLERPLSAARTDAA